MINFSTQKGKWSIDSPTIEAYYQIQNWLALAEQTEAKVRIITLLSRAPQEEIKSMMSEDFNKLWQEVAEGPLSAINVTQFQKEIVIEKIKYGFIDLTALTIGELADLDTLKNHPQVSQQLHNMMAVLYRPIGKDGKVVQYTTEGYNERAELFLKHLKISNVMAAIDFFFHITKISSDNILDSLIPTLTSLMNEMTLEEKNLITKKLQEDGINLSTFLPEMTY
jgi:hypothetical protein